MSLDLPLGGAPGRAGTSLPLTIQYSSKQWRLNYAGVWSTGYLYHVQTKPRFSENARAGWSSSLDVPRIQYTGKKQGFEEDGDPISDDPQVYNEFVCYIPRVQLRLPDGSSHELRKSDTPQCFPTYVADPAFDFSGTFYSTDGARMRFDNDAGVLYLSDGG